MLTLLKQVFGIVYVHLQMKQIDPACMQIRLPLTVVLSNTTSTFIVLDSFTYTVCLCDAMHSKPQLSV